MNDMEPDAEHSQWLWFGAVLLAMMVIRSWLSRVAPFSR
jgi:hypothetical protein